MNPLEDVTKSKNRNEKVVSAYDEEEVTGIFKVLKDELFKWRMFVFVPALEINMKVSNTGIFFNMLLS